MNTFASNKDWDFLYDLRIDQVGVEDRLARITARSIKKQSKVEGLKLILNMIDLTTLEGKDTEGKVKQLCYKAQHLAEDIPDLPTVAAVCVYPTFVSTAKKYLKNSPVKVASVSTAFPAGQAPLSVKLEDTKFALENGADEVDMVINRGEFLKGNFQYVYEEIVAIKKLVANYHARLKVILETGELSTLDNVRRASEIAILAGADFIKTSTGKVQPAATLPVTYVMLQSIREYYDRTGIMVGMKPAGGISNSKTALQYLVMVKEVLGEEWLTNQWFRYGASSLANDVLMQIKKELTGVYQSADYFSKD